MRNVISVIVPIYCVENYLRDCLESILHQTYQNLEIILVDDGSTDNSGNICDEFAAIDSRIKVVHKKNSGVSSARNVGLDIATGDWFYFIDGDDWIEPFTLEYALSKLLEDGTDICFFDYELVYKGGKTVSKSAIPSNQEVFLNLDSLETLCEYMNWTGCWNFVFKASLIKNIRFNEEIWIGEDTLFKFLLYRELTSFSYLKKVLYHYRFLSNSCTGSVRPNLPQIIYKRYHIMSNIIEEGGYPDNAQILPNSLDLLKEIRSIVNIAFGGYLSFNCNYEIIKKYINTEEFSKALQNYNKKLIGRIPRIYLLFGKPKFIWITIVYFFSNILLKILGRVRV